MKKYIVYIAFILVGISCSDEFDQKPSFSLPGNESIKDLTTLNTAINGAYSALVNRWGLAGDVALYADAKGGDVQMIDKSSNHLQPVVIYQTDRNSDISISAYAQFSRMLARVNSILDNVNNVSDKESNKELYNDYLGQLYALRALGHFEMARLFAQIPSAAADVNAENSGIVINDKVYPFDAKFKRSTLKQTYDFIVADLKKSMELLSKKKKEASGKINYWAAEALLSRAYLYMNDNDNALKHAANVIANSPYKLYSINDYLTVWKKTGTSESLFEVLTTDKSSAQRNSLGYYTNPDGYPECAASEDFKTWLTSQTTDIRSQSIREKAINEGKNKGKNKGFYTIKYEGQEGASSPLYVNNFKVIRLSEVYLIAAEAKLKGGNAPDAKEAVWYYNGLRKNRLSDYANTDTTSVTLEEILDERRREFFCENHRMYDMVRFRKEIKTSIFSEPLKYDDYRLLTAIPEREINISPELKQNPNW
ncbi:MAG: RagB/SusD family nutrient uptake outer membrane protein [Tannerella sp.]|uniref:RagB/SusD family nutrient uptake outer membrane protein n=1 Tax=Tannerella sp. TaxID=2382127 RepID=UPI003FA20FE7